VLSEVLSDLRLQGALQFLWRLPATFAMAVPDGRRIAPVLLPDAQSAVSYHLVLRGECWAGLIGAPPVKLRAGDLVLIPRAAPYVMGHSVAACSAAKADVEASLAFFRDMAAGRRGFCVDQSGSEQVEVEVLCGFLGCDLVPYNPVLTALPAVLPVRARPDFDLAVAPLVQRVVTESQAGGPGSRAVLLRLCELMFIEAIRRTLQELPSDGSGWLAGLRHPVVGRALQLLHADPAERWTLERLARRAGTSRSRLAESFRSLVGLTPMRYLARWRMQVAAGLLTGTRMTVAAVAAEVGYRSEAAFTRAFKHSTGSTPSKWRKRGASQPG
jgi:AraC-like DNA-binding protein